MAHEELHLNLRNLTLEDYPQLQELMDDVYEDIGGAWPKDTIKALWSNSRMARSVLKTMAAW